MQIISQKLLCEVYDFFDTEKDKESENKNIELIVSSNGREIIKSSRVKESSNLVIVLPGKGTLRRYS